MDAFVPSMSIIPGTVVRSLLEHPDTDLLPLIQQTYADHEAGLTDNPDSYFLRYKDNPDNRIIALPATITSKARRLSGIKWIASFPGNVSRNLARASAAIILNDPTTGYPFAFMEAATISAARTAASAVLGATHLRQGVEPNVVDHLSVIGSGIIAKHIIVQFRRSRWRVSRITIHDLRQESAQALVEIAKEHFPDAEVRTGFLEEALLGNICLFATSAGSPYLRSDFRFSPAQVVLNVSLRDIHPNQILSAQNVFDDIEHCMKARTSPHLAEMQTGSRDFVTGTLNQIIEGSVQLSDGKPVIFSPFGMGILDLAVAEYIYERAKSSGCSIKIDEFFGEYDRWG